MQKWEYCVINDLRWAGPGTSELHSKLYKLTDKGVELAGDVETILKGRPKGSKPQAYDVVAQMVAQLGEEGWEMVSAGTSGYNHNVYFKRPKP